MIKGRIISSLGGIYGVQTDTEAILEASARGQFRKHKIKPIVGDWVTVDTDADTNVIIEVDDRHNELIRPPVANIDFAVVITAATQPTFSTNLLDRQLVTLGEQHITPIIYFTKTDLIDAAAYAELKRVAEGYRTIGYEVFLPDPDQPKLAQEALRQRFAHHISVVMGQTGAGKSTLLNTLNPEFKLTTNEISQALNRGKHTTRATTLMPLADGWVADTPGFSSFEVFTMTKEDLDDYFPEFVKYREHCQFRDCLHMNEPKCAVKSAVADGQIMQSRYDNYLSFFELIKSQKALYNKGE